MRIGDLDIRDFCVIGRAKVNLDNQGLCLISGINHDSDAADSNGAGKTTMFKALTWCLYGTTIDGEKATGVIRKGADSTEVSTQVIDDDDKEWLICRTRGKSEKLGITGPDGLVVESKEALQERIEKLLGFDFHAFRNTVLYGQEDKARFANASTTDTQRKDILHRILRTSLLKKCEHWARAQYKIHEKAIEPIRTQAKEAQAALDEYDVESLEAKEEEWADVNLSERNEAAKKHNAKTKRDRAISGFLMVVPEKALEIEDEIANIGDPKASKAAARKVRLKAAERVEKARDLIADLDRDESELVSGLEMLDGDECPVCSSDLTDDSPATHITEMVEKLGDVRERRPKIKALYTKCREQAKKADALIDAADEDLEKLRELERQRYGLELEMAEARAERKAIAESIKEMDKATQKLLDAANPYEEARKEAEERTQELEQRLEKITKVLVLKEEELAHYQFWVRGFGGQGLPSFVLDSAMPVLTERTNHYLETLSDGDITMEFSTRTTLKSGDERDKINISWVLEGSEDTTASRGQGRKMEVATDLALMDLAETREGGSLDLLLLDEVLDGLDASGRTRVIDLLHEMKAKRRSIFVISHDPLMAEVFEKVITVVKSGQVSNLEVV